MFVNVICTLARYIDTRGEKSDIADISFFEALFKWHNCTVKKMLTCLYLKILSLNCQTEIEYFHLSGT